VLYFVAILFLFSILIFLFLSSLPLSLSLTLFLSTPFSLPYFPPSLSLHPSPYPSLSPSIPLPLPFSIYPSPPPFLPLFLYRLWNQGDHIDSRIFAYERERGYYSSPVFSPLCSILADIVMFKLFPPIFASLTLYPFLGLNSSWAVWGNFLCALCLMQIAGCCYCKVRTNISRNIRCNLN
jgi:hypothetical protein